MAQIIVTPYVTETNERAFFDPIVLPVRMLGYKKKALPVRFADQQGIAILGINVEHQSIVGAALSDVCMKLVSEVKLVGYRITEVLYPVDDNGEVGIETVKITDPDWLYPNKVNTVRLPRNSKRNGAIKAGGDDKYLRLRFLGPQPIAMHMEYLFDV